MPRRSVALIRGINVGGKNLIRMTDLVAAFEDHGLNQVVTYIQSGNVLFEHPAGMAATRLTDELERALSQRFGTSLRIALRSAAQLRRVVTERPKGFGGAADLYRYDAIFPLGRTTPARVLEQLDPREGVDRVWAGPGVVYSSRLAARAAQSRLSRIVSHPIYQEVTIRNWNTTTRLDALLAG
jgi:uncharacterized protein (DUF1697 family)